MQIPDETVLSPEDHEHFLTHGYLVVRDMVPPEILARAVVALEAEGSDPDFDPAAACTTSKVDQVISDLFGAEYPFKNKYGGQDLQRPHQPGVQLRESVAHVDDAYPTLMPNDWAVGTFIFLTPVQSRGGAFIYFSGSPLRYRQGMAQSFHSIKELAPAVEYSGPSAEFLAEPGDVLFFHHLMGHTGSDNLVDPLTRHALLTRWVPRKRIVPGNKPFAQMSTIEKANSARYLEQRFAVDLQVRHTPTNAESCAILRDGFSGLGSVKTYALLHFNGAAQLLYTTAEDPAQVRHLCSEDFVHWRAVGSLPITGGAVRSLQLHQYGFAAVLAITDDEGVARVYSSDDFAAWDMMCEVQHSEATTPWFIYAKYPSKIAGGQALYVVPEANSSQAWCRWGEEWAAAAEGAEESHAVQAPAGCGIKDLVIAAYLSDRQCAFVADVQEEGRSTTKPCYLLPEDVAVADGELQPLAYIGDAPPHHIRVFNRGPSYWLLTFLRNCGGQDRLFWGCIDWEASPPILRPLPDAEAFDRAKSVVGLI
ncbi:MAG: hypothetical protein HOM86_19740 [Gemmatimonadetes bacterium]|nr:hypothetical protein [Gemmatimonadota bacterium]